MLEMTDCEFHEIPTFFQTFLQKVEKVTDLGSSDTASLVQVYSHNNQSVYASVEDLTRGESNNEDAFRKLHRAVAMICCNQNVSAIAYVFPAFHIVFNSDEGIQGQEHEQFAQYAKRHAPKDMKAAMLAGYETREGIFQAVNELDTPSCEEGLGNATFTEWHCLRADPNTQDDPLDKSYTPQDLMRGFFVTAKHLIHVASKWQQPASE